MSTIEPRLTSLSHGGGCGCKIAPGILRGILQGTTTVPMPLENCTADTVDDVFAIFHRHGFQSAAEVGEVIAAGVSGPRLEARP